MILDAFVEQFFANYVTRNNQILKMITHSNNPLNRLIDLRNRKSQQSNNLLSRLLTRCSNEMRPEQDELLRHSFIEPARDTCTYAILFNDCFASLPIRHETLERLAVIWTMWEDRQMTYEQIWRKRQYNTDQEHCFSKIWEAVGKHIGKQYQIAGLFETAYKEMMEKTKLREKIATCLKDYCNQANDRLIYMIYLSVLQHQIEQSVIGEIRVPHELKQLVSFVERLTAFSHLHAWRSFYINHIRVQGEYSILNV